MICHGQNIAVNVARASACSAGFTLRPTASKSDGRRLKATLQAEARATKAS